MGETSGYPAALEDGTVVTIVEKQRDGAGRETLIDTDGNEYVANESRDYIEPKADAATSVYFGDVEGDAAAAPAPYPEFDPTHGPTDPDPATAPATAEAAEDTEAA